jgi:hypothetical protein
MGFQVGVALRWVVEEVVLGAEAVESGGRVSFVLASKMLKTLAPPQIWAASPGQGMLQSFWFSVHELPTKVPHQQSRPALTPAYSKLSEKQAALHWLTVSRSPPALVVWL